MDEYKDELNILLEYNATFGRTRPNPNFMANKWVALTYQILEQSALMLTSSKLDRTVA